MRAFMPCSGPLLQQNNARTRTISSSAAPRRSMAVVNARLAKPGNTVKGTTTVGAKKQQLAKQLARQEQQQKKTLVGSKTTRGLNNSTTTSSNRQTAASKQAGTGPSSKRRGSRFYFNFTGFPFPLGPFFERKTVRTEVVKGQIWTFEQTQAFFFDVFTPVRMTVIKLKSGGLWVHCPVAPTQECINLLRELDAPVEYIVLPTFAYEHKVFVGPFARRFPRAQVYVTPFQWSFPLNLPPQFFGIFAAGELVDGDTATPWGDEIEQKLLLPPPIGVSEEVRLPEASFYHKASRTLLVTDAVVYVDRDPPDVIPSEALRSQAQDGWLQRYLAGGRSRSEIREVAVKGRVEDTPESRRIAWARMSLLVLYFNPSDLLTPQASFEAISQRLLVGPVVRTLVYSKIPNTVCDWVDSMCADWRFERIIPAHFSAPVKAGPADLKAAFLWCYDLAGRTPKTPAASSNPLSNIFGGLGGLFGGSSSSSTSSSSSSTSSSSRGSGVSAPNIRSSRKQERDSFPPQDVAVLQGLDDLLLRLNVVYDNAEEREGSGSRAKRSSKAKSSS